VLTAEGAESSSLLYRPNRRRPFAGGNCNTGRRKPNGKRRLSTTMPVVAYGLIILGRPGGTSNSRENGCCGRENGPHSRPRAVSRCRPTRKDVKAGQRGIQVLDLARSLIYLYISESLSRNHRRSWPSLFLAACSPTASYALRAGRNGSCRWVGVIRRFLDAAPSTQGKGGGPRKEQVENVARLLLFTFNDEEVRMSLGILLHKCATGSMVEPIIRQQRK